jgi:hypothetical protein
MGVPNVDPIYSVSGDVSNNSGTGMNQAVLTGSNTYDGTNAAASLIFTAGANGSFLQRIRLKPIGTNVASVARFFINNGLTPATAANNVFYGEISLPATTASAIAALVELDYPVNVALPAGFRIYMLLATTGAAGWVATPVGGKY